MEKFPRGTNEDPRPSLSPFCFCADIGSRFLCICFYMEETVSKRLKFRRGRTEAGRSQVHCQPGVNSECQVSLGYRVKSCLDDKHTKSKKRLGDLNTALVNHFI